MRDSSFDLASEFPITITTNSVHPVRGESVDYRSTIGVIALRLHIGYLVFDSW